MASCAGSGQIGLADLVGPRPVIAQRGPLRVRHAYTLDQARHPATTSRRYRIDNGFDWLQHCAFGLP
jgi:hypothetical protein